MTIERTIRYTGKEVTVLWRPHLCIHSKRCWRELPEVFKPAERPWVHPDAVEAERVIAQVKECPSGALSIVTDPPAEQRFDAERVTVEVAPNGPLLVRGSVEVKLGDGSVEVREERCALCRCGGSATKPFCDGSHKRNDWKDA